MVHEEYDWGEFLSVRYYSSSNGGGLSTPETDAAIAYYGVTGYPTVLFNGTERYVGGGDFVATGAPYVGIVEGAYFDPAPVRIQVQSFDPATGALSVLVTMYSETDSLDNDFIRFILIEDDVTAEYTHVTRDIVSQPITLSGAGSTASFNPTFTVDPSWDTASLHAVAFVQRAATKEIVQAASSYPLADYAVRAMVPSSRHQIGPSTGAQVGDDFTIANVGLADTFTIGLVVDEAPAGWVLAFCDQGGACHFSPWEFPLGVDETFAFHVNVIPNSSGFARYHFEVGSPNLGWTLEIPFTYLSDDLDVLVVDDDGGEEHETYHTLALAAAGRSYGVWDLAAEKLDSRVAATYRTLAWDVGWNYPSLDATDRAFVQTYLDAGNNLFISGQDVGWELGYSQSGNYSPTFLHNYLHASYVRDDTNLYNLLGVAGDPLGDGLTFTIDGPGLPNYQQYPDELNPYDANAVECITYQGGYGAAIRADHGTAGAKVVYLGFGFEGISTQDSRNEVMAASIDWIEGIVFRDGFEVGDTGNWSLESP